MSCLGDKANMVSTVIYLWDLRIRNWYVKCNVMLRLE